MKRFILMVVCVFSFFSIAVTIACAEPKCTSWMKQNDGSYFRTCVDEKGRQYCESSKDNHISRVSCR